MQEKTFYRLLFIIFLIIVFATWQFFYPTIKPYPKIELKAPELPELPNPRDPKTWEPWLPQTIIDPLYIYIGVGIIAIIIIIAIIAYYRRKPY